MTGREQTRLDQELVVAKLNRTIIGRICGLMRGM